VVNVGLGADRPVTIAYRERGRRQITGRDAAAQRGEDLVQPRRLAPQGSDGRIGERWRWHAAKIAPRSATVLR